MMQLEVYETGGRKVFYDNIIEIKVKGDNTIRIVDNTDWSAVIPTNNLDKIVTKYYRIGEDNHDAEYFMDKLSLVRGIRKDDEKTFVYGFYWFVRDHTISSMEKKHYVKSINNGLDYEVILQVDNYSCMDDDYGVKIFERDIVEWNTDILEDETNLEKGSGTVFFCTDTLKFMILITDTCSISRIPLCSVKRSGVKIIGNCHNLRR
jgi:hypothetical protein